MKKIFLTIFSVGSIVAAQAQTAGSILVYGDAGFSGGKVDSSIVSKTINWNVSPGVGYQINDNITVGVNISWASAMSKYEITGFSSAWEKTHVYKAGAFARYTLPIAKTPFFLFDQLNAGYQGGFSEYGSSPSYNKMSGFYVGMTPAVGINIGTCLQLNFGLGSITYATSKTTDAAYISGGTIVTSTVEKTANNLDVSLGKQFHFGVSKNFGGHKMKGHHKPMDDTRKLDISDDEDEKEEADEPKKKDHKEKKAKKEVKEKDEDE